MRCRWKLAILLPLLLLVSGCPSAPSHATSTVTLQFGPSDVETLEVYSYTYAASPSQVSRSVVTDRRDIATWVSYFTDLPVGDTHPDQAAVHGGDADGFRFRLRDGSVFEVTHVFFGPKHALGLGNLLIWPDGTAMDTDFGSPTGYSGEAVEPGQRPLAEIR
jgi:hypothetical protein